MENILIEDVKQIFYMKKGNPASSFCVYKHSVVEWFTTKSKVMLEHTLKELSKVTEKQSMVLQRTVSHLVSWPWLNIWLEESLPQPSWHEVKWICNDY